MYACLHVCMFACKMDPFIYIHTYIHTYTYSCGGRAVASPRRFHATYIHIHTYTHTHIRTYTHTHTAVEGEPLRLLDAFTLRDDDAGSGILAMTIKCLGGEMWFDLCERSDDVCNVVVKHDSSGWWNARIYGTLEHVQAIMSDVTFIVRPSISGKLCVFDLTLDDRGNTGFGGALSANVRVEFYPAEVRACWCGFWICVYACVCMHMHVYLWSVWTCIVFVCFTCIHTHIHHTQVADAPSSKSASSILWASLRRLWILSYKHMHIYTYTYIYIYMYASYTGP
jgi:hypothetical protein